MGPGIWTSVTRMTWLELPPFSFLKASSELLASSTSKPARRSVSAICILMRGSSSTTKTVFRPCVSTALPIAAKRTRLNTVPTDPTDFKSRTGRNSATRQKPTLGSPPRMSDSFNNRHIDHLNSLTKFSRTRHREPLFRMAPRRSRPRYADPDVAHRAFQRHRQ